MKKLILFFIGVFLGIAPTHAVLKERNLEETVCVLLSELEQFKEQQVTNTRNFDERFKLMEMQMRQVMQRADQTSLMLYSQQNDYIFDLAYACHEAISQYRSFHTTLLPYTKWVDMMNIEINRYAKLINSLKKMPDYLLDEHHLGDRDSCLILASQIRNQMIKNRQKITELQERHDKVEKRLKELHDYAKKRYAGIQNTIFVNGSDPYLTLLSKFSIRYERAVNAIVSKYQPRHTHESDWTGKDIFFCFAFVFLWMSIASILSNVIIRWLVPQSLRDEKYHERKPCMIWTMTLVTFAIAVMILRSLMRDHGFFQMATELLIEYAWLLGVILISLLIRLWEHPERIKRAMRIYMPIFALSFIVIAFRIVFIPNETVNLIFPPILLTTLIWQYISIYKHNETDKGKISKWDYFYAYLSLTILVICVACGWYGYTLLAVQILIWWFIQLACIQTITCIYTLLHIYQNWKISHYREKYILKEVDERTIIKRKDAKGDNSFQLDISKTWIYDLVYKCIIPVLAVFSVMFSVKWAADVFDLTDVVMGFFRKYLVDIPNTFRISLFTLGMIISLFFVVRYALYLTREVYLRMHRLKTGNKNVVALGMNIITIVVWGVYLIIVMKILHVDNTGIIAVLAGMSTGIGLALKDLIENLFYGISLMTGRVKVGDIVELDGVRGSVNNINYQSTLVETIDGSIIAFQNSQLFTKNFKNLTKNHGNKLVKIPIGIAYGTNVEQVRHLLYENLGKLDCWVQKKGMQILFDNFGESSVDLVLVCWVPVIKELSAVSQMKEVIYKTFNENNIEIPFPQRDVYIRRMVKEEAQEPPQQ